MCGGRRWWGLDVGREEATSRRVRFSSQFHDSFSNQPTFASTTCITRIFLRSCINEDKNERKKIEDWKRNKGLEESTRRRRGEKRARFLYEAFPAAFMTAA